MENDFVPLLCVVLLDYCGLVFDPVLSKWSGSDLALSWAGLDPLRPRSGLSQQTGIKVWRNAYGSIQALNLLRLLIRKSRLDYAIRRATIIWNKAKYITPNNQWFILIKCQLNTIVIYCHQGGAINFDKWGQNIILSHAWHIFMYHKGKKYGLKQYLKYEFDLQMLLEISCIGKRYMINSFDIYAN